MQAPEYYDTQELPEEMAEGMEAPYHPYRKHGYERRSKKLRRKYPGGYSTTKLQRLLAMRGEDNARNLAQQRGRTMITRKDMDRKRAENVTAKTFDGIDILDNLIPYDKNLIYEPVNPSMAAQFGNFQEEQVRRDMVHGTPEIVTYRPCPI